MRKDESKARMAGETLNDVLNAFYTESFFGDDGEPTVWSCDLCLNSSASITRVEHGQSCRAGRLEAAYGAEIEKRRDLGSTNDTRGIAQKWARAAFNLINYDSKDSEVMTLKRMVKEFWSRSRVDDDDVIMVAILAAVEEIGGTPDGKR